MQQYNVIAMTTVRPRQQQEQLRKTTIQTTIQHVAHLPVVDVDDATAAAAANCVRATFLIPRTTWKTQQEPWTTTTPQSRGTKQQQRPQPNDNSHHHQDFFLRFTILKHVFVVPTRVPVPPITTRRRTTSQQEQQAILVPVQQHVIHNHTQNRCRGDCRHLSYQIGVADNYLVIWVYIYYHKIIYKHVLLSSHRRHNSGGNHNSDNKNNNKRIREKQKRVSIVSRVCVHHIWQAFPQQ